MNQQKALIELEENEYVLLNRVIDQTKRAGQQYNVSWLNGVKVVPVDISNLDIDYDEKVMLVDIYFKDPADLFNLGRKLEREVS